MATTELARAATDITAGDGFASFIAEVRAYAPAFADRVVAQMQLVAESEQIGAATEQLEDHIGDDLYRVLPPDELDAEVRAIRSATLQRWLSVVEAARNISVLLPLAVTWLGLHVAATAYQTCRADAAHPDALAQAPFLLLWQNAFGGIEGVECGAPSIALLGRFSNVLLLDFALIVFVLVTTVVTHAWTTIVSAERDRVARHSRESCGIGFPRLIVVGRISGRSRTRSRLLPISGNRCDAPRLGLPTRPAVLSRPSNGGSPPLTSVWPRSRAKRTSTRVKARTPRDSRGRAPKDSPLSWAEYPAQHSSYVSVTRQTPLDPVPRQVDEARHQRLDVLQETDPPDPEDHEEVPLLGPGIE